MRKQQIKNLSTLALATLAPHLPLYGIYAIFWPNAFHYLITRMLPLAVTTFLFLVTANLLSYCDIKNRTNRFYGYLINFVILSCPCTSFIIHSNVPVLEDSKVFYEYESAIFNILLALVLAEFSRRYIMYHEKKYEEQLAEDAEESSEE